MSSSLLDPIQCVRLLLNRWLARYENLISFIIGLKLISLQALGCVPAAEGYFKAIKDVCDKYGALLVMDEVMCGMGRTGTMHAWEQEGVVPDIQTIGKGLGGGYAPIAGLLAGHRVINTLREGSG